MHMCGVALANHTSMWFVYPIVEHICADKACYTFTLYVRSLSFHGIDTIAIAMVYGS